MTIIDQYRAACPTCYNQWDGYIKRAGILLVCPQARRERMKSWALVWHEKPSPTVAQVAGLLMSNTE